MHARKIYLHAGPTLGLKIGKLDIRTQTRENGCTHYLHFTDGREYSRVWVNLDKMEFRRDLKGPYLLDFREDRMEDRIICPIADRDRVRLIRPRAGFCMWRDSGDDG